MLKDIIITIMAILLMGLIMGKAVVGALTHLVAWVMAKLADKGTFSIKRFDAAAYYGEHIGDLDIEH